MRRRKQKDDQSKKNLHHSHASKKVDDAESLLEVVEQEQGEEPMADKRTPNTSNPVNQTLVETLISLGLRCTESVRIWTKTCN
jgi:hypothetical protein